MPSDKEIIMTSIYKKAYVSEKTFDLLKNFDYNELNIVDKLIADFFVLDDVARSELFAYLQIMKKNHSDPEREKLIRTDKYQDHLFRALIRKLH